MKKLISVLSFGAVFLTCGQASGDEGFVVHEWGVVDARTSTVVSLGDDVIPRPKTVKAPVVYFYGDLPGTLRVSLGLDISENILHAEPEFSQENKSPVWKIKPGQNVQDAEKKGPVPGVQDTWCWRDPEASWIRANGMDVPYLFYEASVDDFCRVLAPMGESEKSITLKNDHDFPAGDVIFIRVGPDGTLATGYVSKIEAGETRSLSLTGESFTQKDLLARMRELGFRDGAARAFVDEWWPVFVVDPQRYPDTEAAPPPTEVLVYRLPQEVVDSLLPLRVQPKPRKILRVWWVVDLLYP